MDSRVPTDVEYLNSLRAEVKLAFFKSTGRKLQVSDTRTNPYFKKLRQDIINKLSLENNAEHKPPEVGTIIKFLCKEESVDFTPTNIMIFEDYVFAVKEIEKLSNQVYANNIIHGLNSKGARLINSVFRDNLNKDRDITYTDFYIGKKDKDCQWYGVVRNWDYKRESVNTVKNEILKCFSGESRIAAVITGPGGCGKSTFLRRLAIDCIDEAFRILWIDDFGLFCNDLLHIGNNTEKYVIFLDDWPSVIKSSDLVTFLNRISNYNNVRVIIGDRLSSDEKGYEKYLSGKNVFELPTSENEKIISKIIALNRSWRKSADKILPSTSLAEIYNAPLYMILFVFARDSEGLEYTDIKDIASIFRDIVASDLKRISELYKGLALALYYWSCIYIKYNIHISWEAFLKLADHYNGDMKISKRLFDFNQNTFIHQILFHYVSIKGFLNPDLLNVHIIIFHHNL
ncbi:MAG TPA: hypothetical protein VFE53_26995, partial [Mucilaginibacter sp.]|nr:hypothetical protein [Mucilaginibacter sp.]